jgi:RNA polymerase sigma-70 factor (ECF subfamily)
MPDMAQLWVEQSRRGDRSAMEQLFKSYRSMVFAVGLSICGNPEDADEVVQESFLRAFRGLAEWRGDSKFSTWLYTISQRVAVDWNLRSQRRPPPRPPTGSASDFDREEETRKVLDALRKLPEQQRLALTLRHFRAMTIAEIAEAQGCAEGTIKATLHFAIQRLRELLLVTTRP